MKKKILTAVILTGLLLIGSVLNSDEAEQYYFGDEEAFICPLIAEIEAEKEAIARQEEEFYRRGVIINWLIFVSIIFAVLHIITLSMLLKHIKRTREKELP